MTFEDRLRTTFAAEHDELAHRSATFTEAHSVSPIAAAAAASNPIGTADEHASRKRFGRLAGLSAAVAALIVLSLSLIAFAGRESTSVGVASQGEASQGARQASDADADAPASSESEFSREMADQPDTGDDGASSDAEATGSETDDMAGTSDAAADLSERAARSAGGSDAAQRATATPAASAVAGSGVAVSDESSTSNLSPSQPEGDAVEPEPAMTAVPSTAVPSVTAVPPTVIPVETVEPTQVPPTAVASQPVIVLPASTSTPLPTATPRPTVTPPPLGTPSPPSVLVTFVTSNVNVDLNGLFLRIGGINVGNLDASGSVMVPELLLPGAADLQPGPGDWGGCQWVSTSSPIVSGPGTVSISGADLCVDPGPPTPTPTATAAIPGGPTVTVTFNLAFGPGQVIAPASSDVTVRVGNVTIGNLDSTGSIEIPASMLPTNQVFFNASYPTDSLCFFGGSSDGVISGAGTYSGSAWLACA